MWIPTRQAAVEQLHAFTPRAGRDYANRRNYDYGAAKHSQVSQLSPWIRHRCISEQEVAAQVLSAHSQAAAEKYIQEVCWRTYWKGWLEMRPQVWLEYQSSLQTLTAENRWAIQYEKAISGNTGIECFDHWCNELIETGYLHNHARMWFASIWVFTLKLPWQLGADFFLTHLLDGDVAANTLSWRWVAGLHTKGKSYLARADNIHKYTMQRFNPKGQLATSAPALDEPDSFTRHLLSPAEYTQPSAPYGILLTDEDVRPPLLTEHQAFQSIALVSTRHLMTASDPAARVISFGKALLHDATEEYQRETAWLDAPTENLCNESANTSEHSTNSIQQLARRAIDWAEGHKLKSVITAYATVGPNAALVTAIKDGLENKGVQVLQYQRQWDQLFWPHAAKGFFGLKKKIPQTLDQLLRDESVAPPEQAGLF